MAILRRGAAEPERHQFRQSGELFELTEHLRRSIAGFRAGTSPMPASEARRAVLLCRAAEEACRTAATVPISM